VFQPYPFFLLFLAKLLHASARVFFGSHFIIAFQLDHYIDSCRVDDPEAIHKKNLLDRGIGYLSFIWQ